MQPKRTEKPTLLVTDAGRGSALAFVRSFGRRGWRVVAADSERASPGMRSRHASVRLLVPPPREQPDAFVEVLLAAVREHGVDLVVPITDASILPLARARSRFDAVSRLALPSQPALEVAADKHRTVALARSIGVPVPRTRLVRSVPEALRSSGELGWPVVLKPRSSSVLHEDAGIDSFEVRYADGPARLAAEMERFEGRCEVLLQEYTPGIGRGVELLLSRGRALTVFQHRRLREVPVEGGASALRESEPVQADLERYALRLMEALDWTGLAMVEFKVGPDGPRLLEINGRVWGSLPLAVASGVDFPALLAELYLYGAPAPDAPAQCRYRPGVRARNLELDLLWIGQVLLGRRRHAFLPAPRRREALRALLQLAHPGIHDDFFSLRDPMPGLVQMLRIARKLGAKSRSTAARTEVKRWLGRTAST